MEIDKKSIILAIIIIGLFFVILFYVCFGPKIIMLTLGATSKNPPQPVITYGEFPFTLEYELDGEMIKIEDTIVCEYDGVGFGDNGKFLKWNKYLRSTGKDELLLVTDGNKNVFVTLGDASYYMGEEKKEPFKPKLYIEECRDSITISSADPKELEKYNITIVDYDFSEPIENSFE